VSEAVLSLLDGIAGLPLWLLALTVALAVAAESSLLVGLIVPGDLIVLLAASGGSSVPRAVVLVVAVAAGSVGGETLGYGIGHRWGGKVRASRVGQLLGEDRWDRAGHVLGQRGGRAVFGARYIAAVHAVLPVAAGALRMPLRKFLGWSTAGAVTWAILYVSVGAAAGTSFRKAGEHLAGATLAAVVALGAAAALLWLWNRHRRPTLAVVPCGDGSAAATPRREPAGTGACGVTDTAGEIENGGVGGCGAAGAAGGTGGCGVAYTAGGTGGRGGCGEAYAADGTGASGVRAAAAPVPPTAGRAYGCGDGLAA
jgi:membrane-associated protein